MANLLNWNTGLGLQKKKNGLSILPTFINTIRSTTSNANKTINTANNANTNSSTENRVNTAKTFSSNLLNNVNQINDQIRQQAEIRRQQEERRQRLEQIRQQQEERKQKENEATLQRQQAEQQKQQRLLSSTTRTSNAKRSTSVGDRRSGLTVQSNNYDSVSQPEEYESNIDKRLGKAKTESDKSYDKWLSTTSMEDLSKEMDKAKADNNVGWANRIKNHSGKTDNDFDLYKKQVGAQNSELNLNRSAATNLRDTNDTKTYDSIDVNDSDNTRFFVRQNLLKKTLKPVLNDDANVSGMSYQDVINAYNNASGDQQADIKKAISDEIVDQKEYAKKGNDESLKSISYLADLNALLNEYGSDKGKSFGKQLGDWLTTGGFVGNIGGNTLTEALGNITGTEDATKAHLEKQQNQRTDLGAVGAVDAALSGVANTGLNLGTGGWYGIANAGLNTANTLVGLDDKVLDFDDYGQASLREKETGEKISELGGAALNDLFAVAGKAGIGPGLGSGSLKDVAKYAWQEPLWAGITTMTQEGLNNLGSGKDFGDYDWGKVSQSFAANVGQDIGMDLFNLGRTRAQMKVGSQGTDNNLQKTIQNQNDDIRSLEDGTIVKINADGSVSRLTDSELARVATSESDNSRVAQQSSGRVDNNMDGVIAPKTDNNMDGMVDKSSRRSVGEFVDDTYSKLVNRKAVDRLANGMEYGSNKDVKFARASKEWIDYVNSNRKIAGQEPLTDRQTKAYIGALNKLGEHVGENKYFKSYRDAAQAAYDLVTGNKIEVFAGNTNEKRKNSKNTIVAGKTSQGNTTKSIAIANAPDGGTSLKDITPRQDRTLKNLRTATENLINNNLVGERRYPTSASSDNSLPGMRSIDALQVVNKPIVAQNGENVNNSVTKLADLGYDLSGEMKSKAKKVAKKAANIANEHPLGGTTKLVDTPEVEGSGPERRKFLNFSGLEDPVKDALKSGKKMTTQEFFKANNIESNDLTALKQNYPNEVAAAQKLIKAGVTPETFDSKVFNSDGSRKTAYKGQEIPPMRAIFEMAYNYNKVTDVGSIKDQKKANIFSGDSIKENTMGESSLAKNMSNNEAFSEKTRNKLAGDPVEYKPTTNEERLARANEILSTKSLDEVDSYLRDNYFDVKDKYRNSGDTVLAGEFAKMLDADGQYGRATEIINKMSEIATKQGQQIQALSIMSNRSPEGIANMAQTAIQKGGGKVDGELRKQILSNTQDIGKIRAKMAELNTENSDISYKIMNGEGDLPALRKRQMEIGQEYRTCLDQEGRSFAKLSETVSNNRQKDATDIFGTVWRAGLLSGPRTHTGNAVSNIFQNALNAGADRIASGLDWARTRITGGEREVVSSAGGRGKGLKRGLSAAGEVMKTGTNLWEGTEKVTSGQGANAWGYGGELEFKNKIADTMVAKPTNYVFRAMSAGDLPFRYSAFENAIRTEAKRQGMNQGYKGQALQDYINSRVATPDPDLRAYGINKGNESVYDADTFLSRTMSSLDKQINKIPTKAGKNAAKIAKTLVVPFVKVPSKVLSTAVDYSPAGAVQAIVKKIGKTKNYSVGQFETDLAKSGLGTSTFVGLGYALSSAGLLTGSYPDDDKERDRWKNEGIEPNSIKIGDKYVSLNYLGPTAILMGMGAGVQKRQEKGEDPFTMSVGSISDTVNAFLGQSYVQGLNDAVNAVKDPQRHGGKFANSMARGVVPNLLRQTATATDPKQRQVDTPLESVISGIPGLSQTLNAKVDTYGREIENKQTMPLGQMWDALKISNSRETNAVMDEVSRLHSVDPNNKELQVTPPTQDKSVSINKTNVKLTGGQRAQLQKDIGSAALKYMQQVMESPKYNDMSDEDKAKALKKAREDAQSQARKQFIAVNNITAENNPGTQKSGGEVEGNFADKAVTNVVSNTGGKNAIVANNSLEKSSIDVLDKYNSMSKEDWDNYIYGDSAESAAAEYDLAKAKYENDLAEGKLNDAQKVKREKELKKLSVSKDWEKKYRDAYGLAGSKSDMQDYLNGLDDAERAETVSILNGLNRAMYDAGVIQASTYKTRSNAINGTTTAKSSSGRKKGSGSGGGKSGSSDDGISSAEATALSNLAKTMVNNTNKGDASTTEAPTTKRKMANTKSSSNKTELAKYNVSAKKKINVTKGPKRSIA